MKTRLVRTDLKIQRHRRGTSPRMNAIDQERAVQRVVHTEELTPRDRAAAILVLVFGQQIEDVVRLTWDEVVVADDLVRVRIGAIEITLPCPLDEPWRELAVNPGNDLTAAHPNSNWVFRGYSPGRHIDASHLRNRLRHVFSTRAARLGTLHELTKLAPLRSWPRRWATTPPRSSAMPSTRPPHTADMSQPSGAADGRYDLLVVNKRVGGPRA